ncbi:lysophospholipase [Trametes coccinea BRFM310]|uniref:Lysophospholipase n=1 Tax=Trametes coccinea (strain BRFM310) TaxID=1353009 RepID=A0A1Y2J4I5_TRAC3|nr:lysophospholipase [Trametes coccinea BRFM310]
MSGALDTGFIEEWQPGHDGVQFYTRTYPAASPRAVLLLVHGFAEHIGRYEWAHARCAHNGITVFAFDQRGFGRTALDSAHKSKGSSYGKTDLHSQMRDIEWWLQHLRNEYPSLPIFAMGHSMGGALVLAFATRSTPPPAKDSVALLSGVIASSPLVLQHVSTSRPLRFLVDQLSKIFPNLLFDASLPNQYLSRDPEVMSALESDPLVMQKGSLKCLSDMLNAGESLYKHDYQNWPSDLPVIFLHGDADKVTSYKASREFFDKLQAKDKNFETIKDAFHELVHEPKGVKERFMDDCISWILERARNGRHGTNGTTET